MKKTFIKERLFCPGPTPVPMSAKIASMKTSVYHRTADFYELFLRCRKLLAPYFGTSTLPLILTSSGTGAMETAMVNLTNPGDKVLTIAAGKFGQRWTGLANAYKCDTINMEVEWGKAPDCDDLKKLLLSNPDVKIVFFQANETSTGVQLPIQKLVSTIKTHSNALVVVDAISALGAIPIEMDKWGIDCLISGSQKGFGVPPGLSFIALSDDTWNKITNRSKFYFDLRKEKKGQDEGMTAWTPAASLVAALEAALVEMESMGLENIFAHHEKMTKAVRAAVSALGMELFAKENESHSLTSFFAPSEIKASNVLKKLKNDYGMVFAGGQDHLSGKIIRFAHLGFVDRFDILSGIAALEFALHEEGYKFDIGTGVSAAMKQIL